MRKTFDEMIATAQAEAFEGWDFSRIRGRIEEAKSTWDYDERARQLLRSARAALDVETGGGEKLVSLAPLPARTFATESYAPNARIARDRLDPLGVRVLVTDERNSGVPLDDASVDVVLCRHGAFDAAEVYRVLRPRGSFLTQQVGSQNLAELNSALGDKHQRAPWNAAVARDELEEAGFDVTDVQEEFSATRFNDIGAVVYFLRAVPWQVVGFDPATHVAPLRRLHSKIERDGAFVAKAHRFLIEANR